MSVNLSNFISNVENLLVNFVYRISETFSRGKYSPKITKITENSPIFGDFFYSKANDLLQILLVITYCQSLVRCTTNQLLNINYFIFKRLFRVKHAEVAQNSSKYPFLAEFCRIAKPIREGLQLIEITSNLCLSLSFGKNVDKNNLNELCQYLFQIFQGIKQSKFAKKSLK